MDTDFQIGSIVTLAVYNFQLLKADDFTINYMKERPDKFPEISIDSALHEIKCLAQNYKSYDDFLVWLLKSTFLPIQTSTPATRAPWTSMSSAGTSTGM